jgi:hypothetical protein
MRALIKSGTVRGSRAPALAPAGGAGLRSIKSGTLRGSRAPALAPAGGAGLRSI